MDGIYIELRDLAASSVRKSVCHGRNALWLCGDLAKPRTRCDWDVPTLPARLTRCFLTITPSTHRASDVLKGARKLGVRSRYGFEAM